jgi:hypothetical protein
MYLRSPAFKDTVCVVLSLIGSGCEGSIEVH